MRELDLTTGTVRRFGQAFPIYVALNASDEFTGRGVTLAVLDSAFVPHPDLTGRIVAYHDASGEELPLDAPLEGRHWHGSMTAVVAAGNGMLSDGLYRSLAPDVSVALVKVGDRDGIDEDSVVRGLHWILHHRRELNIRVVTTSIQANDEVLSAWEDAADRTLEELVEAGTSVVCAAGNDGRVTTPPANSPSVLSIGGVSLAGRALVPYDASCYGETVDGFLKPELVALASQVPGPILPGSADAEEARSLWERAERGDEEAQAEAWSRGILSPWYKAVDGTSFSAPVVASVIAQMYEANSDLHPRQVRQILMQTADRIDGLDRARQGFGLVNPLRAVERAWGQPHREARTSWFCPPRREGRAVMFRHYRPLAREVAVAADFTDWQPLAGRRNAQGLWTLSVDLPDGVYQYKLVIDGVWREDPANLRVTPDGVGGVNSVLELL